MKTHSRARVSAWLLALCCAGLLCRPAARAEEIEAVSSRASEDYVRAKQADGSYQPETYAFAKGGYWSGDRSDKTIDKMGFTEVAQTISVPLASQNYLPAKDPKSTKLMIMVYWGTTIAPEHASDSPVYQNLRDANDRLNQVWPTSQQHDAFGNGRLPPPGASSQFEAVTNAIAAAQAENRLRDNMDRRNAEMLGYDSWWDATYNAPNGSALELRKQDMLNELEQDRYFVVLMAYDFQLMWKEKKPKLLWETRFSVSQHHNEFDKELSAMAQFASKYFGQDSHGLDHRPIPLGRVDVGEVKSLGALPEK